MRAFDLAASLPWAITEDALATLLRVAARKDLDPAAVAAQLGRPLVNTQTVEERAGVAILPVTGPIFRYANLFTEVSGATSLEILARDFRAALDNPQIDSILLNIDSPGGQANGVAEFAAMIHAARDVKPIVAYVGGIGASAAYWIACACGEIVAAPTAILGSIGVVAAVPDPHADGETITFVSSQSPHKRPDPTTKGGKAEIQRTIDALASEFVDAVAQYRGVTAETVVEHFGSGGVNLGRQAVPLGMADTLGSYEATVARLVARQRPAPVARRSIAATTTMTTWSGFDGITITQGGTTMAEQETMHEAVLDATMDEQVASKLAELEAKVANAEQARLAAEERALTLSANVAALNADARRKRFKDEVLGTANDGTRWLGAADENVETLETLADALGEDSPKFQRFVQRERTRASQMRAAGGPLTEIGTATPQTTELTALARLDVAARALREQDGTLTIEAARARVLERDGALRDDILAEQKGGR
jgi:signal peptide peptidase SppA